MTENPPNSPERINYLLTARVIERGHAPDVAALARLAGCSAAEAVQALSQLSEMHGVILEPGSDRVWSLHPFALTPTSLWVSADDGRPGRVRARGHRRRLHGLAADDRRPRRRGDRHGAGL
jgi:hypothetical protein